MTKKKRAPTTARGLGWDRATMVGALAQSFVLCSASSDRPHHTKQQGSEVTGSKGKLVSGWEEEMKVRTIRHEDCAFDLYKIKDA